MLAGNKRKRNLDEEIKNGKGNYKRPAGVFKNILKYHSESSDNSGESGNSSDSDSSEYDFIKKAKEQSKKASSAVKVNDIDAISTEKGKKDDFLAIKSITEFFNKISDDKMLIICSLTGNPEFEISKNT